MARIYFQDLQIGNVQHAAGVFSGHNVQLYWKHSGRQTDGMGSVSGDQNLSTRNTHVVVKRQAGPKNRGNKQS